MVTLNELNKELNNPELNSEEKEILQKIEDEIEIIIRRDFKNSNIIYYSYNNMYKLLRIIPDKRHKFIINQLISNMSFAGWKIELRDTSSDDMYYNITPINQ